MLSLQETILFNKGKKICAPVVETLDSASVNDQAQR